MRSFPFTGHLSLSVRRRPSPHARSARLHALVRPPAPLLLKRPSKEQPTQRADARGQQGDSGFAYHPAARIIAPEEW